MQNRVFTKKLVLQASLWAALALLVFVFWGKAIVSFVVKEGIKVVGVVLLGFAAVFGKVFRKKS
mgnify:CR=1 FL=1